MPFPKGEKARGRQAPEKGNQRARTGSIIRGAIRRALAENRARGRNSLNKVVHKLIDQAEEGDIPSMRELFDRIDGKVAQGVALTGKDGGPVEVSGLGPVYGIHPTSET